MVRPLDIHPGIHVRAGGFMPSETLVEGSAELGALEMLTNKYVPRLASGTSSGELARELEERTECDAGDARAFVMIVDAVRRSQELAPGSMAWAGHFARRAAESMMKKGMATALTFLAIGAGGLGVLVLWNPRGVSPDTRNLLQWLVIGFGVVIVIGILGMFGTAVSWLQYRGTEWPAHAADVLSAPPAGPNGQQQSPGDEPPA